jgi:hypothetical protein
MAEAGTDSLDDARSSSEAVGGLLCRSHRRRERVFRGSSDFHQSMLRQ